MSILCDEDMEKLQSKLIAVAKDLGLSGLELETIVCTNGTIVDNTESCLMRASMLIRIHEALGTTYPTNPAYRKHWLFKNNRKLREKPIIILMTEGYNGMVRILSYLDCTFSWDITGSKP